MKSQSILRAFVVLGAVSLGSALLVAGCGKSDGVAVSPVRSYATSSNVGDFATWTINEGNFNAVWNVTDNSGAISAILNITGSCGAPNATYGFADCTVAAGASCSPGPGAAASACTGMTPAANDKIQMLEVPGVALLVYTTNGTKQLHTGMLLGNCASDISGDYTFISTGPGNSSIFGMYRSNADFSSIIHSDFGLGATTSETLTMQTSDGTPAGSGALTPAGLTCVNGVRTFTSSGQTIRASLTASGLMVVDLPSGSGGLIAFKGTQAATLADMANMSAVGMVFPDNGAPTWQHVTMGGIDASSHLAIASSVWATGTAPSTAGQFVESAVTAGSLYGFNASPTAGSHPYNVNLLAVNPAAGAVTYPTPSTVPGLFIVPDGSAGGHNAVIMAALKLNNGKVLAFGAVTNDRSGQIKNTGNFIMFQQ